MRASSRPSGAFVALALAVAIGAGVAVAAQDVIIGVAAGAALYALATRASSGRVRR